MINIKTNASFSLSLPSDFNGYFIQAKDKNQELGIPKHFFAYVLKKLEENINTIIPYRKTNGKLTKDIVEEAVDLIKDNTHSINSMNIEEILKNHFRCHVESAPAKACVAISFVVHYELNTHGCIETDITDLIYVFKSLENIVLNVIKTELFDFKN